MKIQGSLLLLLSAVLVLGLQASLPPQSGYVPVLQGSQSAMYYLFYPAKTADATNVTDYPIIVWLQGGPASSFWIANLFELGPNYLVNDSGTIKEVARDRSWNCNHSLLFLDNPIGIGYSYAEKASDIPILAKDVAGQLYTALVNLLQTGGPLNQFAKTDLFLFAEYYAGKFIAELGMNILQNNQGAPAVVIQLKGLGFGSGWVDPPNQNDYNGVWGHVLGIFNDEERRIAELNQFEIKRASRDGDLNAAFNAWGNILDLFEAAGGGINLRNFRLFGEYEFQDIMNSYLNRADVQKTYNARPGTHYVDVNLTLLDAFGIDWMGSNVEALMYVLDNLPVLFFNGQDNAFCPLPSHSHFMSTIRWKGQREFNSLEYTNWNIKDGGGAVTVYGNYKSYDKLSYFIVNKAGNYIAMDQMNATLDMLYKWIPKSREGLPMNPESSSIMI